MPHLASLTLFAMQRDCPLSRPTDRRRQWVPSRYFVTLHDAVDHEAPGTSRLRR